MMQNPMVICLFFVLFWVALSQTESPPVISTEWQGKGIYTTMINGQPKTKISVKTNFSSSAIYSTFRMGSRTYLSGFPDEASTTTPDDLFFDGVIPSGYENATWYPINTISIIKNSGTAQLANGVCRHLPFTYTNIFSIVPYTTYNGTTLIGNDKCEKWIYVSSTYNATLYVSADNTSIVRQFYSISVKNYVEYDFLSFTPNVNFSGTTIFDIPEVCTAPGMICEGEGVKELEMIRFHPPHKLSMVNDNSADYIGDAFFMCTVVPENLEPTYQWISKYIVSVDTAWGNYGLCNLGFCWGMNRHSVGRQSPNSVQEDAGQCLPESIFGKWYSLPEEGQCPEGEKVGFNNCTWREDRRVATIELQCLLDLGFLQACKEDISFPYPQSSQLLKQALNTCPPPQNLTDSLSPSNEIPQQETSLHHQEGVVDSFVAAFHDNLETMINSLHLIKENDFS